jgi:hypothetical protein
VPPEEKVRFEILTLMLRDEWSWLETQRASERERPGGVPLGLFADVTYGRLVVKPQSGDLMVL